MDRITLGLPNALTGYRWGVKWRAFFEALGMQVVTSGDTTRELMENGIAVCPDESCLAAKIYLGHVMSLKGRCDRVLIPSVNDLAPDRVMCTRFAALPDMARNTLRDPELKLLTCRISVQENRDERDALTAAAQELGFGTREAHRAYRAAERADRKQRRENDEEFQRRLKGPGLKILILARPYVAEDAYIGRPVTDFLAENGAVPIPAYLADRDNARRRSGELSPTCRWEVSRELIGALVQAKDRVDGIILMSAFPCGPDAMVNDMLARRVKGKPMLNLVLDGQSGTAGVETRLESFLDIIRFKGGAQ